MARARKLYLVLDTETVTAAGKVIDLGYKLVDRTGEVYASGSYITRDLFCTEDGLAEIIADRFTRPKVTHYLAAVRGESDEFTLADFADIRNTVNSLILQYHPVLAAYNIAFDLNALNKTSQMLLGCDFFVEMPEILDIWAAAMSTICKAARYVKFIADNGILTRGGNPQTGAEAVYKFITGNTEFEEAHTAAADCEIETEILTACLRCKKRMRREPVGVCVHCPEWQEIVKRYYEYVD